MIHDIGVQQQQPAHAPSPGSKGGTSDGERRIAADLAFAALCKHAAEFDFGLEVSGVRRLLQHERAVSFGDVVTLLGSRVAARFAVLQLAGTGEIALLAPCVLRDATPPMLAPALEAGSAPGKLP